jgi:hypothetical protein
MVITDDQAAERVRRIGLRRALRAHLLREPSQLFWSQVAIELRADPTLDENEAIALVAKSNPALWTAAQHQSTALVRGGPRGGRSGLGTAPETDEYGQVHPVDLTADDIKEGVCSLTNGPLVGHGKSRGRESIEDSIDPKRTSAGVKDLDSQEALRTAARARGYQPVDERLLSAYMDADQIDQDADAGNPDAQWVVRSRDWLRRHNLPATAENVKRAFKETRDE